MRAVAAAVGLAPTAMYTYFPSKAALMGEMVERLLAGIGDPAQTDADTSPTARLSALAIAAHRAVSERPGAAALLMSGPLTGRHALSLNERLLAELTAAGLGREEAARAAYALQVYVLGSAILASVGAASDTHVTTARTDSREFPLTDATRDVAAQHDSAEQFEWGLARLLHGLVGSNPA